MKGWVDCSKVYVEAALGAAGVFAACDIPKDEVVERLCRIGFLLNPGWRRVIQGLESPELSAFLQAFTPGSCRCLHLFQWSVPWVRGTHLYPFFKVVDNCGWQFAIFWHAKVIVVITDGDDQSAFFGFAGDDDGTVLPTALPTGPAVEVKPCLEFLCLG